MLVPSSLPLNSLGTASRILTVRNDAALPLYFVVQNMDDTLGVTIEYQESSDGNTFTTIVGTSKSIDPGLSDGQIVTSNAIYIALQTTGAVLLQVGVVKKYNNNLTPPTNIS